MLFQVDNTILLYNLKSNHQFPSTQIKLKSSIVAADINENYLLIGLESSQLAVIETKNLLSKNPEFIYDKSGLYTPVTSVSIKKTNDKKDTQFVISSCDGRISFVKPSTIKYYGTNMIKLLHQTTIRAAKLDTTNDSGIDKLCHITNVQCLNSNVSDLKDLFITSAANGELKIWHLSNLVPTLTIMKPGKEITAARVNDDCSMIAFATGYSWSQGIWGLKNLNYSPEVFVRIIEQCDLTAK